LQDATKVQEPCLGQARSFFFFFSFLFLRSFLDDFLLPCFFLGDFLVIEVNASNTKVDGDIMQILYPAQIKHLKQQDQW